VGIFGAIAQSDIKRLLSFTLVSHIGYMVFGVALSSELGMSAAIYYVAHHILVQTTLFLVVGLIERQAGSASLRRLGGLIASPVLAVLFLVPALNLGGIPPFSGFIGKVALLEAGVQNGSVLAWILVAGSVVTSLLTLYVVARIWTKGFWRPRADAPEGELADQGPSALIDERDDGAFSEREDVGRMPAMMVLPTFAMVVAGLVLTLWAGPIFDFTDSAATDVVHRGVYVEAVLGGGESR
jgi:multicomponent Na+:H+ antiporter subunit D